MTAGGTADDDAGDGPVSLALDDSNDQDGVEAPAFVDGAWGESAPRFNVEVQNLFETVALQPEEIPEEGEDGELDKLVDHMFERDPEDYPELEPELQRQLEQVKSLQQEIAHDETAPPPRLEN